MTDYGRLHRFIESWEPSLSREFLLYDSRLRLRGKRPAHNWVEPESEPYWKELPIWLIDHQKEAKQPMPRNFLSNVTWGQTALFYSVRIQDDILDGDVSRSLLILAPILFLDEARMVFTLAVGTNAVFWDHYHNAIERSVAGIARAATMERDPETKPNDLLNVYGDVDGIFSVGSSAICAILGMTEAISPIDRFVSEIGRVLLTLDDLADIREDLADGRLTYPARVLLGKECRTGADIRALATNWQGAALPGSLEEITKTLLDRLRRANDAIAPLRLSPAMKLIDTISMQCHDLSFGSELWKRTQEPGRNNRVTT